MRANIECAAVADASRSFDPQAAANVGRIHWTRWACVAALLVACPALLLGARDSEHVARIERLAAKIERARGRFPRKPRKRSIGWSPG
jgi:hypothetical protein